MNVSFISSFQLYLQSHLKWEKKEMLKNKDQIKAGALACACNPVTLETEAGG